MVTERKTANEQEAIRRYIRRKEDLDVVKLRHD